MSMKTECRGCPFAVGMPDTEMAYNLGCLPSISEIAKHCGDHHAWPCHSAEAHVCAGFKDMFPSKAGLPLRPMSGVHRTPPSKAEAPMPDRIAKASRSSEESSLREKVARIIDPHHFSMTPKDYGLKDAESFKGTMAYGAQLLALQKADAAIAVCMEEAAKVAELDADWTRFGKPDAEQWEGGPDALRDYRIGIASGRAIAASIRTLDKWLEKPGKGENG